MGLFGWSLPPGCGTLPGEEDEGPCEMCGRSIDDCICQECQVCGATGDPSCYAAGSACGMVENYRQVAGRKALEARYAEQAKRDQEEGDYWASQKELDITADQ